ncbi:MAG TPA: SIMPL domain-containing protein [Patescibacteria group bacterium]|nr:SIMPL domain-containing protein [Patescibacteria group bacterium]
MNSIIKNIFGGVAVVLLLVLMYVTTTWVTSYAKSHEPSTYRSFSVSAEGKVVAVPDVAEFSFTVITNGGRDISKLQKENTEKVNSAIEYVKGFDVDEKDIRTTRYSIDPRYTNYSCPEQGGPCPPSEITGYSIRQSVQVKVRNFDNAGKIIAGVVDHGANSVSQLSFRIDDVTVYQDQARAEAIGKAQQKAKMIANVADFKIGKLLTITDGFTPVYQKSYRGYDSFSSLELQADEATVAPVIEPGSTEIMITVTLNYEIE